MIPGKHDLSLVHNMTLDIHNMMLDDARPNVSVYKNSSIAQIRKWLLTSSCSAHNARIEIESILAHQCNVLVLHHPSIIL